MTPTHRHTISFSFIPCMTIDHRALQLDINTTTCVPMPHTLTHTQLQMHCSAKAAASALAGRSEQNVQQQKSFKWRLAASHHPTFLDVHQLL